MYLKKIYLSNFRNYDELLLDFNSGINIIYGDNAQGKTNLLESIYVLGLTKSHRSFIDNNLIKEGIKYSQIKGIISENDYIEMSKDFTKERERLMNLISDTKKQLSTIKYDPHNIIYSYI